VINGGKRGLAEKISNMDK